MARRLTAAEVAGLLSALDFADPTFEVISAKALATAIADLPQLRRDVFLAVLDNTPRRLVAERFGLNVGEVDRELQLALEHGLRFLQRVKG